MPTGNISEFSYGSEHVSDDTAVGIIERLIQSVERVRSDAYVDGEWSRVLDWLHGALAQVWTRKLNARGLESRY